MSLIMDKKERVCKGVRMNECVCKCMCEEGRMYM